MATTSSLRRGGQQGDRLGPLLFCLALHPLGQWLQSELLIFYLGDGTVGGGPTDSVLNHLRVLESGAAELGLQLNQKTSELISDDPTARSVMLPARSVMLQDAPNLHCVSCSKATLLGSPMGDEEGISWSKASTLEQMGEHLNALPPHDAPSLKLIFHTKIFVHALHCPLFPLSQAGRF